jgi:2,5-furandicarboxylate decarboxylase 1
VANPSLRLFLDRWRIEHPGDVVQLDDDTDIDCLTALALELEHRQRSPVLMIDRPRGFDMAVVTNLFSSWDRIAGVLGVSRAEFNDAWLQAEARATKPVQVHDGPVHDVVLRGDDVDVAALPIPRHFATDGGRYISGGILVANDPDTGARNLSFQRMQLKGPRKLGVSLHSRGHIWDYLRRAEARDEPLEVAVVIGAHPAFLMAATCRLGIDVDEYDVAGGLLGEPVELVQARTIGVDVPAEAELVIEGRILPNVREPEGPFGEFPGYSSHRSTENVFEVTAITRRTDPIFLDVVPGNSSDHLYLATLFREPHLFRRVSEVVPTLRALHLPKSGTTFHCYLSMKKTAEGMPRSAMLLLFGMEPNIKLVIACDEDIDVHDTEQVMWALATRFQADTDLFVVPSVFCNELDPSARDGMSTRLGIDATTPAYWRANRCEVDDETREMVQAIVRTL